MGLSIAAIILSCSFLAGEAVKASRVQPTASKAPFRLVTTAAVPFKNPPYALDALEPHYSKKTMDYHWGKHHKAYVDNLNKQIEGTPMDKASLVEIVVDSYNGGNFKPTFNNAAQVWNHEFFWESMKPNGGGKPTGQLLEMINRDFGSYDEFATQFKNAGATQFGSGWAWLSVKGGKLIVEKTPNAVTPVVTGSTMWSWDEFGNMTMTSSVQPILTMDVWEHAYYLDHMRRPYCERVSNVYLPTIFLNGCAERPPRLHERLPGEAGHELLTMAAFGLASMHCLSIAHRHIRNTQASHTVPVANRNALCPPWTAFHCRKVVMLSMCCIFVPVVPKNFCSAAPYSWLVALPITDTAPQDHLPATLETTPPPSPMGKGHTKACPNAVAGSSPADRVPALRALLPHHPRSQRQRWVGILSGWQHKTGVAKWRDSRQSDKRGHNSRAALVNSTQAKLGHTYFWANVGAARQPSVKDAGKHRACHHVGNLTANKHGSNHLGLLCFTRVRCRTRMGGIPQFLGGFSAALRRYWRKKCLV
eukprot:jgi/Mesvir1/17296/Mv07695-RA.1